MYLTRSTISGRSSTQIRVLPMSGLDWTAEGGAYARAHTRGLGEASACAKNVAVLTSFPKQSLLPIASKSRGRLL